jgi:hypothetical protein
MNWREPYGRRYFPLQPMEKGREKALNAQSSDQRGGACATSRRRVSRKRWNVQAEGKAAGTCIYGKRTRLHRGALPGVGQQIDRADGMGADCGGLYSGAICFRPHRMAMCHSRANAGRADRKLVLNALRCAHRGRRLRHEQSKQQRRQHDPAKRVKRKAHNHFSIRCSRSPSPPALERRGGPSLPSRTTGVSG